MVRGKIRNIARTISAGQKLSYFESLKTISRRVACVQLVPYHSPKFPRGRRIYDLPSSQWALDYVRTELKPLAAKGNILIVVLRQSQRWGIGGNNIINYNNDEAIGAHVITLSRGGDAILRRLRRT